MLLHVSVSVAVAVPDVSGYGPAICIWSCYPLCHLSAVCIMVCASVSVLSGYNLTSASVLSGYNLTFIPVYSIISCPVSFCPAICLAWSCPRCIIWSLPSVLYPVPVICSVLSGPVTCSGALYLTCSCSGCCSSWSCILVPVRCPVWSDPRL